ncbi:hypothetical protein So717_06430 [Roseobacter cerasinus]|uniref:VPLPA-CTERM protein sorting domain-containing protein n=1 Tax=Roseobacter cerasinus TaxID=2602289 RepID=A0A640VN82_9RHOB|nr:hypothetical protein [Roseobacter cerasinus]GFE48890.1 hypothetical protein So717_06430 [Roseobacter cerasinus]
MTLIKSLLASLFLLAPLSAQAAQLLIFEAQGEALVDGDPAGDLFAEFFDLDFDDTDIAAGGQQLGGLQNASILITDLGPDPLLESSDLLSVVLDITPIGPTGAPTEDFLTLVFGSLTGADADLFGDTATVVFSFFAESLDNSVISPVTARVYSDLAPIPLPASLPLLAVGGIALLGLRRRSSR